jgi:lipid IVA palmitoyltransferase
MNKIHIKNTQYMSKFHLKNNAIYQTTVVRCLAILIFSISANFVCTSFVCADESDSFYTRAKISLNKTWQSTDYELYVPVYVWHNRSKYTSEKIDEFNEQPWGLGIGKYRYDEDGDWHGLYAMAFLDSHNDIEPIAGYGFEKNFHVSENLNLGLGYTAGVTMRKDLNYIPIPLILPLLSVQYKRLAVQSTYVPGGEGNGNILFTWLRWTL